MRLGRFLVRYSRKVESAGRLPDTWTQTLIDNQVIFQKPINTGSHTLLEIWICIGFIFALPYPMDLVCCVMTNVEH
jgi:hypothetical protein